MKLNRLERVLEGIWSGELEHNQKEIVCGTARCVCGWYAEFYYPYPIEPCQSIKSFTMIEDGEDINEWWWAEDDIGLTGGEASLFFDSCSTKAIQIKALEALKKGRRLNIKEAIDLYAEDYNESSIIKALGEYADNKKIRKFLEI